MKPGRLVAFRLTYLCRITTIVEMRRIRVLENQPPLHMQTGYCGVLLLRSCPTSARPPRTATVKRPGLMPVSTHGSASDRRLVAKVSTNSVEAHLTDAAHRRPPIGPVFLGKSAGRQHYEERNCPRPAIYRDRRLPLRRFGGSGNARDGPSRRCRRDIRHPSARHAGFERPAWRNALCDSAIA